MEASMNGAGGMMRRWPESPPPGVMVDLRGIRKTLGGREVLKGVDLSIPAGDVVAVIGPSGSGKTTLLRCINFLERPDAGEVWVDGRLVGQVEKGGALHHAPERLLRHHRTGTGMVFQQFN